MQSRILVKQLPKILLFLIFVPYTLTIDHPNVGPITSYNGSPNQVTFQISFGNSAYTLPTNTDYMQQPRFCCASPANGLCGCYYDFVWVYACLGNSAPTGNNINNSANCNSTTTALPIQTVNLSISSSGMSPYQGSTIFTTVTIPNPGVSGSGNIWYGVAANCVNGPASGGVCGTNSSCYNCQGQNQSPPTTWSVIMWYTGSGSNSCPVSQPILNFRRRKLR